MRLLVNQLESKVHIELAHVNPKHYPPLNPDKDCCISRWFIGLSFEKAGSGCGACDACLVNSCNKPVNEWS